MFQSPQQRKEYSLSTAFMKKSLKILDTYMHSKGILVRFTHAFFLPLPPDLLEAHSFFQIYVLYFCKNQLNPITTAQMYMDVVPPTEAWATPPMGTFSK